MLLSPQQFQQVSGAIRDLTPTQLAWVSGYLSGLTNHSVVVPPLHPLTLASLLFKILMNILPPKSYCAKSPL